MNTVSPPLDSSPESKNKRGNKKMTDWTIEEAVKGWIESLLEELANPALTEEEKRELEEELAEIL